jgi:hypothetical protein
MSQNRQFIPLKSCITHYLDQSEQSNHKYYKLFHLGTRGMDDMGLDFFYAARSFKIPVNANLTATIPGNVIKITKVGVFNQQGDVIPLSNNNKLSTAFDLAPTRLEQTQDNTIPTQLDQQGVWFYNYWNGNGYGNLYGYSSGVAVGSYKIDNQNGVIVLGESFYYPYVLIEAICSEDENNECYLPIQFREAMIAWLAWQDTKYIPTKTHVQNSSVEARRRDYYNERKKAIAKYDPISIPDLYQWQLENQRMTVKA